MELTLRDLPSLNAALNATAGVLLVLGWVLIRRGKIEAHRRAMLSAFGCSIVFLVSYLVYHFQVGSVRFQGTGTVRTVYLTILLTHTVLAAAVPFLARSRPALRAPQEDCPLDPADLALRLGHRRGGLLDALPDALLRPGRVVCARRITVVM